MKKEILFLVLFFLAGILLAQAPQSFKYQAVARDADGQALVNASIGIEISIISNNIGGSSVYTETFTALSNQVGVFNLNIGQGNVQSGSFADIDWGADNYFLNVAIDVDGGSNYSEMGTSQLLSVPYSLHTGSIYVHYSNDTLYIGDTYVIISGGGGPPAGTVEDFDGNVYETVTIGTQTWMKENLRSLHYADGTVIEEAYAYDDNESNVSAYGRLYSWNAVMRISKSPNSTQGICPDGWHVPTLEEAETLEDFLGGNMVAGGKMKETGLTYWLDPNEGATNESGFSARGSGTKGTTGNYENLKEAFYLWLATEYNDLKAKNVGIFSDSDNSAVSQTHPKTIGYSARCIKN